MQNILGARTNLKEEAHVPQIRAIDLGSKKLTSRRAVTKPLLVYANPEYVSAEARVQASLGFLVSD